MLRCKRYRPPRAGAAGGLHLCSYFSPCFCNSRINLIRHGRTFARFTVASPSSSWCFFGGLPDQLARLQRDKALRGLASSICVIAAARREGLAESLVHGGMEGWRRIATALRHNRTSTLSAHVGSNAAGNTTGRSARRRCSVECGAPQTSLQNRASLRGITFEASACFWIASVSAQSMV